MTNSARSKSVLLTYLILLWPNMATSVALQQKESTDKILGEVFSILKAQNYLSKEEQKSWSSNLSQIRSNLRPANLGIIGRNLLSDSGLPTSLLVNPADPDWLVTKNRRIPWLGVLVKRKGSQWFVKTVFPKTPADKAGIKRGDQLLEWNQKPFTLTAVRLGKAGKHQIKWRSFPWTQPKSQIITLQTEVPAKLLLNYSITSSQSFIRGSSKGRYIHLWINSNPAQIELTKQINESISSHESIIIDLRDSFSDFSSSLKPELKNAINKLGKVSRIIGIVNPLTQGPGVEIARQIQKTTNGIIIGSSTDSFYQIEKLIALKEKHWFLRIPEKKGGLANSVRPDKIIAHPLVYAGGQDEIIPEALSLLEEN